MAVYKLTTPISGEAVRKLSIGDIVYVSGDVVTARDQAHRRALTYAKEGKALPVKFEGIVVFHCGPVARKKNGEWEFLAAGPTTSARMDAVTYEFIEAFKPKIIVGKGGMGVKTTEAAKKFEAVYGDFTGGAGVLAAKAVKRVKGVEWLDLGMPEALWILEVENFGPLTIAIDSKGNNLHQNVAKKVEESKAKVYKMLGIST